MKLRVISGVVLAVVLVGLLLLLPGLKDSHQEALAQYEIQWAQLEQRKREVEQKQEQLDALLDTENGKAAEAARLEAEIEALEAQKQEILTQTKQLKASIEVLRQEAENEEDSDKSYYLEVYDVLTEGLEKVKNYIAGH